MISWPGVGHERTAVRMWTPLFARGGAGGGRGGVGDMNTLCILGHPELSQLPHFMHYGASSPSHATTRNIWAPSNPNHSWPSSLLLYWLHSVPLCVSITSGLPATRCVFDCLS